MVVSMLEFVVIIACIVTPSAAFTPVTLLSGFLGTGKTTTLKHLLENQSDLKIGVVVNDVASVNIDRKLVAPSLGDDGDVEMVTLENGCVCCSLKDELAASVDALVARRPDLDAVVVELSGVADPSAVRRGWTSEAARIRRVVTLVDVPSFGDDYMSWDSASERPGWARPDDGCAGRQQVAQLLAQQLEGADLIVLNKMDLAGEDQVRVATEVAQALNGKAEVERVEFGRVNPRAVLGLTGLTNTECLGDIFLEPPSDLTQASTGECCSNPDCGSKKKYGPVEADADMSTESLGFSNFVYRANRPFTERIMPLLQEWPIPEKETLRVEDLMKSNASDAGEPRPEAGRHPFVGALRSKGFCWFAPSVWAKDASRHDEVMIWSHAGRQFQVHEGGKWYAALTEEERRQTCDDDEWEQIKREDFKSADFGDRRQELVFIGIDLQEEAITKALDACVCTNEEMEIYGKMARRYQVSKEESVRQ